MAELSLKEKNTLMDTACGLQDLLNLPVEYLSPSLVSDYLQIFVIACNRLAKKNNLIFPPYDGVFDFLYSYPGGVLKLSLDYYEQTGRFLFGIPSQLKGK